MTSRRRLIPESEIKGVLSLFKEAGLPIGAVEIRFDGMTVHPPGTLKAGNAYDAWKAKDSAAGNPWDTLLTGKAT